MVFKENVPLIDYSLKVKSCSCHLHFKNTAFNHLSWMKFEHMFTLIAIDTQMLFLYEDNLQNDAFIHFSKSFKTILYFV